MEQVKILFDFLKNNDFKDFIEYIQKIKDIDLNIRDESGNYLINYAILKNSKTAVKILLEKGCRIDIYDQEERSLLYVPIKYDYYDIITLLLEYDKHNIGVALVDIKDKNKNIPLHYAIFFNNIKIIKLLLDNNSNVNIKDDSGSNALHLAIYSKNYEACKLIVNKDININMRNLSGESALHIACNLELIDIVKLLLDNGININAQDHNNEFTSLMYAITRNNKQISKILLEYGADPNIQDFIGNTSVHYSIIEENYELLYNLLKFKEKKVMPNLNVFNIDSNLPIHLFLQKDKIPEDRNLKILIDQSNLNLQNNKGYTPLHYLCEKNLWKSYKDVLSSKKLNIFIINENKKMPIDYIIESDRAEFLDVVTKSYLHILRNKPTLFKDDWENICNKELFHNKLNEEELKIINKYVTEKTSDRDLCYDIVMQKLIKLIKNRDATCENTSYPVKKSKECIRFDQVQDIEMCSFIGITLDILIGVIYLLSTYDYACSTVESEFVVNEELSNYYETLGLYARKQSQFLNFEIVWAYKKLFFSNNFKDNFNKCLNNKKKRFIIIPLGIEIDKGSHANYLIFDKKTYELERFEPYGAGSPYKFNYDKKLLDNILLYKFNEINEDIKYISPDKFLPRIGFQYFDVYEEKTIKIGDPHGFCALWSIWYTEMRLKYPNIDRKSLVKKILKEIKIKNISFKNIIRNYSTNITSRRDNILKQSGITINEWFNDQFDEKQYEKVILNLKQLISKYH